jgi:hypothetical protein
MFRYRRRWLVMVVLLSLVLLPVPGVRAQNCHNGGGMGGGPGGGPRMNVMNRFPGGGFGMPQMNPSVMFNQSTSPGAMLLQQQQMAPLLLQQQLLQQVQKQTFMTQIKQQQQLIQQQQILSKMIKQVPNQSDQVIVQLLQSPVPSLRNAAQRELLRRPNLINELKTLTASNSTNSGSQQ